MIQNNVEIYRRLGNMPDGKVLYEVKDDYTQKYKKFTVPEENADKCDEFCNSITDSSLRNFKANKFIQKIGISGGAGAIVGAGISLLFSKNKKVLSGIVSASLGCLAGVVGYFAYFANKLHNVISEAKKLGIEEYK